MDAPDTIAVAPAEEADVTVAPEAPAQAARFDFRHPVFLSSAEWRKLRMEVDEFVESTAALLSTYLRLDLGLQISKLHTITFGEFTSSLPSPTHLTLFKT